MQGKTRMQEFFYLVMCLIHSLIIQLFEKYILTKDEIIDNEVIKQGKYLLKAIETMFKLVCLRLFILICYSDKRCADP